MHYAIGDVQGCLDELQALLTLLKFNPLSDTIWFCGDLVNRGPNSLGVLRFLSQLVNPPIIVLGNHDLHLLAIVEGLKSVKPDEYLEPVLNAPDRDELCNWLCHQRLFYFSDEFNTAMVHAGLAPQWDLTTATNCAQEIESLLRSNQRRQFLQSMYGDQPNCWDPALTGEARTRYITNVLTRIRFCTPDGKLDLSKNESIEKSDASLHPWFDWYKSTPYQIVFGHWAAINGVTHLPKIQGIDTGCVWGNYLTALCLETGTRYQIKAQRRYAAVKGTTR